MMVLGTSCPICGKHQVITVDADGYTAWNEGALIQDALPELTASEREALITGICDDCWNLSFGDC